MNHFEHARKIVKSWPKWKQEIKITPVKTGSNLIGKQKDGERMKELIDKIISDFNFEKVHKAMLTTNWCWYQANGDTKVPSIVDLVLCARELLQEVSGMDIRCSVGTGGFKATKIYDSDQEEGLELEFILTHKTHYTKWLDEK
jgi:hypothetical protein